MFLDGLRGVAAILVLLLHWLDGHGISAFGSSILAVDFFFILSGFVIAYSYEEKLRRGREDVPFLRLRIIRLYPLLLLGIFIGFVRGAVLLFEKTGQFFDNQLALELVGSLFMVPDDFSRMSLFFPLNTPLWSLHFEIIAYAAFYFFLHKAQNWQLSVIALAGLAGCSVWAISAFGMAPENIALDERYAGYVHGFSRVSLSFVAGILIFRFGQTISRLRLPSGMWLTALLFPLVLPKAWLYPSAALALLVVVFPYVITAGMQVTLEGRTKRIATALGDLSYPLYIIHVPVIWIMSGLLKRTPFGFDDYAYNGIFILPATVALSYLVFLCYDRPVRKYLRSLMIRGPGRTGGIGDRTRPA